MYYKYNKKHDLPSLSSFRIKYVFQNKRCFLKLCCKKKCIEYAKYLEVISCNFFSSKIIVELSYVVKFIPCVTMTNHALEFYSRNNVQINTMPPAMIKNFPSVQYSNVCDTKVTKIRTLLAAIHP